VITATIIFGSLLLAVVYTYAWLRFPRVRKQIEQPKHWFQEQVETYDRQCRESAPAGQEQDAD
jgi:hypothetical protein